MNCLIVFKNTLVHNSGSLYINRVIKQIKGVLMGATEKTTSSEPSLRFYHSEALRDKTDTVLNALESKPEHKKHGHDIAGFVSELVEAGMDYYFMTPLKQADIGFVAEKSARLGISSAAKLISSVSRKYIVRMDRSQLLVVSGHIQSLTVSS
jgi:hypothetical protein